MKKLKFSLFTVALVAMTLFSVACAEEEEVVVVEEEEAPCTAWDWEVPEVTEVVIVNVFVTLAPRLAK